MHQEKSSKKIDLTKITQTKMNTNNTNTSDMLKAPPKKILEPSSKPPILDTISFLTPEFVSEFKTSISVGADFTFNDITVQLVDDLNNTKKLYVHCYRVMPVPERSVTLKSGQIVMVDLNYANGSKFVKKELRREVVIPANSDINTLESYLENGHLVIKCLLRSESFAAAQAPKRTAKLPPAPLHKAPPSQSHSQETSQSQNCKPASKHCSTQAEVESYKSQATSAKANGDFGRFPFSDHNKYKHQSNSSTF